MQFSKTGLGYYTEPDSAVSAFEASSASFLNLVHLPKWWFDRKRISANSKSNPNNSNLKAQKPFQENEMT